MAQSVKIVLSGQKKYRNNYDSIQWDGKIQESRCKCSLPQGGRLTMYYNGVLYCPYCSLPVPQIEMECKW